jgi:hypothetical protein
MHLPALVGFMIHKSRNLHIENDKVNCPYLLAASFNNLIEFKGSFIKNNVLFWCFSPRNKAYELINLFHTKTEPHIPAKDLFNATTTFWEQVYKFKAKELDGKN